MKKYFQYLLSLLSVPALASAAYNDVSANGDGSYIELSSSRQFVMTSDTRVKLCVDVDAAPFGCSGEFVYQTHNNE